MHFLLRDLDSAFVGIGAPGCFIFVIGFIVLVAFLSAVIRVLNRIDPDNRRIEPGQVWLNLLPLFNLFWLIVTVERVGESIRNEMIARGRHRKTEAYGKTSGLAWLILTGLGAVSAGLGPVAAIFLFFAFIYWIIYWAQLGGYARRLRDENASYAPPADEGW